MRRNTALLFPLLALSVTVATATAVHAQYRDDQRSTRTSATLRVSFGTRPHWTGIGDTRVEEVTPAERPSYDVFRYGGSYYAYDNNQWYMSPRESGDFTAIDDRSVPSEFTNIPRDHWRSYPAGWQVGNDQGPDGMSRRVPNDASKPREPWRNDRSSWRNRRDPGSDGAPATLRINMRSRQRWTEIRGTRIREIRQGQHPDFDMFYFGGSYYAYTNNRWYMSPRRSGDYELVDDRYVPNAFTRIPRDHWRHDPSGWVDENGNSRYRGMNHDRYGTLNDHASDNGYQH